MAAKERNKLVGRNSATRLEIWLEVRSEAAAAAAAASVNLRLCRRGGSLDETGGGAKFPGQTPLCVAVLTMKPLSKLCFSQV